MRAENTDGDAMDEIPAELSAFQSRSVDAAKHSALGAFAACYSPRRSAFAAALHPTRIAAEVPTASAASAVELLVRLLHWWCNIKVGIRLPEERGWEIQVHGSHRKVPEA